MSARANSTCITNLSRWRTTLLGRFAIHQEYQGQKLARFLLMDALHRSWKNTSEVASVGTRESSSSPMGTIQMVFG